MMQTNGSLYGGISPVAPVPPADLPGEAGKTSCGEVVAGAVSQVQMMVPFDSIVCVEDDNGRTIYADIEELAASIKAEGMLINPLRVVKAVGELRLLSGFRRYRALKSLNWGTKLVPVLVCEYLNDPSIYIANLVENTARDDMRASDLAKRLRLLEEHWGVPREEISRRTTISKKHVSNLIRADKQLCDDVKEAWRKKDIPTRFIIAWAALPEAAQVKELEAWEAEQEERGDVKRKRKSKETKEEKAEAGDKSEAHQGGLDEDTGNIWQTRESVIDKLEELRSELSAVDQDEAGGSVRYEALKNKLASLRWVVGEIKKL